MQDQASISNQGFDTHPVHNPNWSISTIISTSCVILDESQDPNFNLGCAQGEIARAVARTSIPINSSRVVHNQPEEETSLCPMNSQPIQYSNLDINNDRNDIDTHLYEPAGNIFNWTDQVNISSDKDEYFRPSLGERLNDYGERSQANCLYFEKKHNDTSSNTEQGTKDYPFNSRAFLDNSTSWKHDQVPEFPLEGRTYNEYPMDAARNYASSRYNTFDQFNISASNHLNGCQVNRFWVQEDSAVDQNGLCSDNWPSQPLGSYPMSQEETFSSCCKVDRGNREQCSELPSHHCSYGTRNDKNLIYVGDNNNHRSQNSPEQMPESFEWEPYEYDLQGPMSDLNSNETSYGQYHNNVFFEGSAQQMYKNNRTVNGDEENTLNVSYSTTSGQLDLPKSTLESTQTDDHPCKVTSNHQGNINLSGKTNDSSWLSSPYSSNSDKSFSVTPKDKKKDTAESLQRQLLILEERRKDTVEDVRQTGGEHSRGHQAPQPSSHDRVVVDVDHMICSGITVAGFKPRATIRKRSKVAISGDDKDRGYWQKRRKNNDSARKSREAKKEKEKSFYKRALELEYENMYLQRCLQIAESKLASVGQKLILPPLNNHGFY